jgi:hypothetical protein
LAAEENMNAQVHASVVAQVAAAEQATSDALKAFKAGISEKLSAAISMSQLAEMKAEMESELQSIRSCLLHGSSSEVEVCSVFLHLISASYHTSLHALTHVQTYKLKNWA